MFQLGSCMLQAFGIPAGIAWADIASRWRGCPVEAGACMEADRVDATLERVSLAA